MAQEKTKKKSLMSVVFKEYKYEGLIFMIIALVGIVVGVELLLGVSSNGEEGLVVNEDFFFIGAYPKLFAWIIIILGTISIIFSIWPYYKPSIGEIKRVTWPTKKIMLENTVITLSFILILAFLFIGYDALLNQVVKLFRWLADLMH